MTAFNCLIMGAAGRDFHDFQTFFRDRPEYRVRAFTATQIPYIEQRSFPRELAGEHYDEDVPIFPEQRLPELIEQYQIDFVFLAYSDLPHAEVMHKASLVQACGASFVLLGPRHTQLVSRVPVISVTAVRTGAGKSPLSQFLAARLTHSGRRVGVIRHPMPYGDLSRQVVQRFAAPEDLDHSDCTVEEREEYEPYVEGGHAIFAGVDYRQILAAAEAESDMILWDGGNNDFSFFRPSCSIVVADALRPGHELQYYPGETNFRAADILVINKVGEATPEALAMIRQHAQQFNPKAPVLEANLVPVADHPERVEGARVLVVEDGPTLTHGGMTYGAGTVIAKSCGAREIVDPHASAVRSIGAAYEAYPHIGAVLPALGYSAEQREDLEETIRACPADVVIDASPARLERLITVDQPVVRVTYRFEQIAGPDLLELVEARIAATA